jgi:hypothetical protein
MCFQTPHCGSVLQGMSNKQGKAHCISATLYVPKKNGIGTHVAAPVTQSVRVWSLCNEGAQGRGFESLQEQNHGRNENFSRTLSILWEPWLDAFLFIGVASGPLRINSDLHCVMHYTLH